MRSYNERKHNRFVKGIRRIKEDMAQHGADHSCQCFEAVKGKGRVFSRFADTPKLCSNPSCCGNPRRGGWGVLHDVTIQELKAPKIEEW